MGDFKLDIEVKVTVKPVNPKVGTYKRGPWEKNQFLVRELKSVMYYNGLKTDIAGFVADAIPVISEQAALGLYPPAILSTDPYDTLAATAVNLNATGDNKGVSTAPTAEYGVTEELGTSQAATVTPDVSDNVTDVAYVFALTGLTASTKYYYRIKVVSTSGTTYGELKTFTTPAA